MPPKPVKRPLRRRLRRLLLPLLVLGLTGSVIAGCSADRLVLGEDRSVVDAGRRRRHIVRADGKAIECWVARPAAPATAPAAAAAAAEAEPEAIVLFFCGKNARADRWATAVAAAWGDRPVEVWGVNYPGFGGTEGPGTLARVGPVAVAAFDAAAATYPGKPIYVHAASFGTTVGLHVAARRPVAGLLLQNPPPLRQLLLGRYGWWNLWLLALPVSWAVPPDLDSIANAAKVTAPAIFVSSDADEVVPPSYQQKVIDAYAGPKRVVRVAGGRHSSPLTKDASEQVAAGRAWLRGFWVGAAAE